MQVRFSASYASAFAAMQKPAPNFPRLDSSRPDVAAIIAAMLQARQAVERRSWASPQEPTDDYWWADVLADPSLSLLPAVACHLQTRSSARLLHACRRAATDNHSGMHQMRMAGGFQPRRADYEVRLGLSVTEPAQSSCFAYLREGGKPVG